VATQTKLYTDVRQSVPPNTWYRIKFDEVLRDDEGWYQGDNTATDPDSALIRPDRSFDGVWSRLVKFDTIGAGVAEGVQINTRFVRDPYGTPDNTGESDGNDTPGQDIRLDTWQFKGNAGQPVAIEVRHNHTSSIDIIHAQFVVNTWDF
jgi:hypothetical protein